MKYKIKALSQNKFFRGGFYLTASNFIAGFLNYLATSLTGKALGPAGYSEIVALFSYLAIFGIPFQVLNADFVKRLGSKGKKRMLTIQIWEIWFWQRFKKWRFLFAALLVLPFFLPSITHLSILSSFVLVILLFITLVSILYVGALQALHLFLFSAIVGILAAAIKLVGPTLVLLNFGGLGIVLFFIILSTVFSVIASKSFLTRHLKNVRPASSNVNKRIAHVLFNKQILITTLSILGISLLNNLDVIFVKRFFSAEEAGIYGAWSLFAKIILYVVGPITTLSFIYLSSREHESRHTKMLVLFLAVCTGLGLCAYTAYSLFGNYIINLIFNNKYISILPYLPKAALFGLLYTLIIIINGFYLIKKPLFSIISLVFIPFYFVSLLIFGKSLAAVININIVISSLIFTSYVMAYRFKTPGK